MRRTEGGRSYFAPRYRFVERAAELLSSDRTARSLFSRCCSSEVWDLHQSQSAETEKNRSYILEMVRLRFLF